MDGVQNFFKTIGGARLAAMGAVAVALIGIFAILILRLSTPQMAPLFTSLAAEDSGAIVRELEGAAIPYELTTDGSTIRVPEGEVARLRMTLAEQGLPSGGGVGYEIFDNGSTLGATSFVQNVNHLRALEGELSRSIRSLSQVQAARVHLVLPERRLFSRETQEATASIVLDVRGRLGPDQVAAVQHLVASAIPGMQPTRVSIVDQGGRLLASGRGDEGGFVSGAAQERALAFERRLQEEVEAIVESVVGQGRARVQVAAEMDHTQRTETAEIFDPESRVIRSTQTSEETSSSSEPGEDGGVTVGEELPDAQVEPGAGQRRDERAASEEVVNYEISRTTRTEVVEAGGVKRLSVAVLVDGLYETAPGGEVAYAPRPQEQIDMIAALVRSSVGFSEARGDTVEIVNLRFAELPETAPLGEEAGWAQWIGLEGGVMRLVETAVLALLVLFVVLLVVRPLVRRILGPDGTAIALPSPGMAEQLSAPGGQGGGQQALPGGGVTAISAPPVSIENKTQRMLEIAELTARMHNQSVQKIGDLITESPNDAVAIVRNWLQEPA